MPFTQKTLQAHERRYIVELNEDKEWKIMYKFCINHGYENYSLVQKELLKKAINDANNVS